MTEKTFTASDIKDTHHLFQPIKPDCFRDDANGHHICNRHIRVFDRRPSSLSPFYCNFRAGCLIGFVYTSDVVSLGGLMNRGYNLFHRVMGPYRFI